MFSPRIILLVCLLRSIEAFSQEPIFRHYTTINGLPSSETYSVVQDGRGYIWISTDRGLARFNGYEFKVFSSGQAGLNDNTIFGLHKDQRQRIWYHTYNGSIGYFYDDSFRTFPYIAMVKKAFQSRRMDGISIDGNGGFMSVAPQDSFNKPIYIDKRGNLVPVNYSPEIRDIYFSVNNTCVVAGKTNAKTTRLISQETLKVFCSFPTSSDSRSNMTSFICRRQDGDIFVYCAYEIFLLNETGVKQRVKCKERVLNMMLDKNGNLWVGYINKGLEMYKGADLTVPPLTFKQLSQNSIAGMVQDKEGGFWFTTLENGVFYLPPDFIFSYGKEDGLSVPKVRIIENTKDKLIFLMSDHSLAYKYHSRQEIHKPQGKDWQGFSDVVSTASGEVYYTKVQGVKSSIVSDWKAFPFQTIHVGKYNTWGYISGQLQKYVQGITYATSFDHIGRITCIHEIGLNEVLVGTLNGLYKFSSGKINSLKSLHPVFQQRISSIADLGDRHIAFATIGSGVLIVERNGFGNPVHYTKAKGLPSDMCNVLISENDSTLIVGTNKGVCRISRIFDVGKAAFYTADVHNGLISSEVNDIEIVGDDLWIATVNGLSILPKKLLAPKQNAMFLNMEEIRVANRLVKRTGLGRFPYEENDLQFTFSGISFQYASKLRYKYRLNGSDNKWNFSSNRSVIYNGLSAGDYTFEVRVIDANGKERPEKISYSFSIQPPFWRTWWFAFLICFIVVYIIYLLVSLRIRRIREQVQVQNDLDNFRDKALRSQMNPHFIYNSMNAIQNYISKNQTEASIDYLNMFSRLMRTIFNNSGERAISLEKDLETVALYVEMENMRFSDKFSLHISYDDKILPSLLMVPPFLIQPFVENSILHGFRAKDGVGNIWIHVEKEVDRIRLSVRDDGVGREETLEAGRRKQVYLVAKDRGSSGIKVTLNRIRQAWGRKFSDDMFRITDLYDQNKQAEGTLVEFYLPLIKYD